MAAINVLDSTGATVAIEKPNVNGRAAAASSRPVALSTEDLAAVSLPAKGQTTASGSLPVVLASDQTPIGVQGSVADGSAVTTPSVRVGGFDAAGLKRSLIVDPAGLLGASIPYNETSTNLGANALFTPASSRDSGAASGTTSGIGYFNGFFFANQTGTATLEGSWDNTNWFTTASAAVAISTPVTLQVPLMFRYNRPKFQNGGTANTLFQVSSSYTRA